MAQPRRSGKRTAQISQTQQPVANPQFNYGANNQPVENGQFTDNRAGLLYPPPTVPAAQPQPVWNGQQWVQPQPQGYYPPNQIPNYNQPQPPAPAQEYDNDMRGVLFKNERKVAGDRRPDYVGNCTINGVFMYQSVWVRKSNKTGQMYMSVAYNLPDQENHPGQQMNPPADNLPF
jgi:hypothetical protein